MKIKNEKYRLAKIEKGKYKKHNKPENENKNI